MSEIYVPPVKVMTDEELRGKLLDAHGEIVRLRKEVDQLSDQIEVLNSRLNHVTTDRNNLALIMNSGGVDWLFKMLSTAFGTFDSNRRETYLSKYISLYPTPRGLE